MEETGSQTGFFPERWICYFDLLGFSNLVQTRDLDASNRITMAVEEFKRKRHPKDHLIKRIWFSDTFVFYTHHNTVEDFAAIEQTARHFFHFLIKNKIPVRGAMVFGKAFADEEYNILFGQGLLEAHCYGENQDWIGFVIAPSAAEKITELGHPLEDFKEDYREWPISFKKDKDKYPAKLWAFRIVLSYYQQYIYEMREHLPTLQLNPEQQKSILRKYDRTIEFMRGQR